jgi:hypothetical protein
LAVVTGASVSATGFDAGPGAVAGCAAVEAAGAGTAVDWVVTAAASDAL